MSNPEEEWENTWKAILENPDGSIDKEQLKKELADFSDMIDRMTELTSRLTGGVLSYPTYSVDTIIEYMENNKKESEELDEEEPKKKYIGQKIQR